MKIRKIIRISTTRTNIYAINPLYLHFNGLFNTKIFIYRRIVISSSMAPAMLLYNVYVYNAIL